MLVSIVNKKFNELKLKVDHFDQEQRIKKVAVERSVDEGDIYFLHEEHVCW